MLVGGETELALVDFGNLLQAGLKILARLVLNASVLDEAREVMLPLAVCLPAEPVNVGSKFEWLRRIEGESLSLLYCSLEHVKAHPINGIL